MKILAYPLTIIYFIFFGVLVLIFHPIQVICLKIFGYNTHRHSVNILNWFLMQNLRWLGTRFTFSNPQNLPTNRPIIFAANHQSMYDIPPLIWYLRKHHPKFIAKKELGSGIPSISYNLKHGGACLIDRSNQKQAVVAIETFGKELQKRNRSAVIFPEGTRSRNGTPKQFSKKGLSILIENMPDALVVPVSINNSWKLLKYGSFPMGLGAHLTFMVHEPVAVNAMQSDQIIAYLQNTIHKAIVN